MFVSSLGFEEIDFLIFKLFWLKFINTAISNAISRTNYMYFRMFMYNETVKFYKNVIATL